MAEFEGGQKTGDGGCFGACELLVPFGEGMEAFFRIYHEARVNTLCASLRLAVSGYRKQNADSAVLLENDESTLTSIKVVLFYCVLWDLSHLSFRVDLAFLLGHAAVCLFVPFGVLLFFA